MLSKICIVPLDILNGYAYVEYFPSNTFGNQVKLYNVFTTAKLNYEQLMLENPIEMVPRILMNGEGRTRKYKDLLKWDKIGEREIPNKESYIMYKSGCSNQLDDLKDWSLHEHWIIFDDINFKKKLRHVKPEQYSTIKHLPIWTHYNYIGVTEKIAMYWAKQKDISLDELFDDQIKKSPTTKKIYMEVINSVRFIT